MKVDKVQFMSKLNSLGYVVLSDSMNAKVFGEGVCAKPPRKKEISAIKEEMENFGVEFPSKKSRPTFSLRTLLFRGLEPGSIKDSLRRYHIQGSLQRSRGVDEGLCLYRNSRTPGQNQILHVYAGWVKYPFNGSPEDCGWHRRKHWCF
jgi:hypothetical protein